MVAVAGAGPLPSNGAPTGISQRCPGSPCAGFSWAPSGACASTATEYERHAFALELSYLRDFSSEDITRRSLDEMRRLQNIPVARTQQWERALRDAFPSVKAGDRISGVNRPGMGVQFLTNGQLTGDIRDVEFARLFFGIWLLPDTSEPRLRQALLAQATP